MQNRIGKPAQRCNLDPHNPGCLAKKQAFMPSRKASNAFSGGAKRYHVSWLQREIATGLGDTGLDRKTVIASMIPGENLVIDRAGDM